MRTVTAALAATFAVCAIGYVSFFTALPANSAEVATCYSVADAERIMTEHGLTFEGAQRYQDGTAVIYRDPQGLAYAAPIDEKGCVSPVGIPLPGYKPEVGA